MTPSEEITRHEVTRLLIASGRGERGSLDRLLELVYDELRRLAGVYLGRERAGHTLQPTALVHEAYMRLVDQQSVDWQNRAQFFGLAARMMRRVLINHARDRSAAKRGGGAQKVTLAEAVATGESADVELLALDEALGRLEEIDPELSRVVELRYFVGLTIEETAAALGVSESTVKREWDTAKAWLYDALRNGEG